MIESITDFLEDYPYLQIVVMGIIILVIILIVAFLYFGSVSIKEGTDLLVNGK